MREYRTSLAVMVVSLALLLAAGSASAQQPDSAGAVAVLDATSPWHVLESLGPPMFKSAEGVKELRPHERSACKCMDTTFQYQTAYPPEGWTGADFDDSAWQRRPFFGKYINGETDWRAGGGCAIVQLRQLNLRGKFAVTDPAAAGPLKVRLSFRGGAVVYCNGKEIARAFLPAGKVEPGAPAELYPTKAYVREDGKPQLWFPANKEADEAYQLRIRKIENVTIPADVLRKGINVLAVEIHGAMFPEEYGKIRSPWGSCGFISLRLEAKDGAGVVPNIVRPKGVQAWNTNVMAHFYDVEFGDPNDSLKPLAMAAPKNGWASARLAVGSDQAMANLQVKVSELKGPGGKPLPASAVSVGFGTFARPQAARHGGTEELATYLYPEAPTLRDNGVCSVVRNPVPVADRKFGPRAREDAGLPAILPGAVQPVWVMVHVPPDAAPGYYRGSLTVTFDSAKPIEAPIELKVIDWALPDPKDFAYFYGLLQSPEGVAMTYDLPLWSDKHWEYIGKSLDLVGQTGGKVLLLPLTAESQYGNAQSLVLWIKGADGKYTHDFTHLEKYVDTALAHMGKPRFTVVGVWDSCMHVSVPAEVKERSAKGEQFPRLSVLDPKTGAVANIDGPIHGSPEALELWKPVLTKVKEILAKKGLADQMLLGYDADVNPSKRVMGLFHEILPDVAWQATKHHPTWVPRLDYEGGQVPVVYQSNVWGGWDNHDPDCTRVLGWNYKDKVPNSNRTWLDRALTDASPIPQFRACCEQGLLSGRLGLGQVGADFWPVRDKNGQLSGTLVGRFPATNEGNLGIYVGGLLFPGPDGPVPSVPFVMVRENIQECEARIFLEKLLLAKPCPLDETLARKCQQVLDERTRWHRMQGMSPTAFPFSGWEARTIKLYEVAAEAAKAAKP